MIKFIIDKIHLRNVRNYGDEGIEMDFPVGNLTVFTGHVGAGKSTILKSISMALYGDDGGVKGEKLSIDDMVNERNGKNLEIDLYFHSLDTLTNVTDQYEIHLYHKHKKYQNKLVFMKNGVDISANGKMDTYRLIEKTIIPKDVYHNIYYFTQQAKNFFTALPNSEQKAIFDSILDLSDYDKYYENCRTQIATYEKLVSDSDLQIKMIQSGIAEKQSMIDREKENITNSITENQVAITTLKSDLDKAKKELDQFKSDLLLEKSKSEIEKDIVELESNLKIELNNISNQIDQLNSKISETNDRVKREFESKKVEVKEQLQPKIDNIKEKIHNSEVELAKLQSQKQTEEGKLLTEKKAELDKYESEKMAKLTELQSKDHAIVSQISQLKASTEKEVSDIKSKASDLKMEAQTKLSQLKTCIDKSSADELANLQEEARYRDIILKNTIQLNSDTPHCDKCGQPLVNLDHLKKENEELLPKADLCKELAVKCKSEQIEWQTQISKIKSDLEISINDLKQQMVSKVNAFKESETKLLDQRQSIVAEQECILKKTNEQKTLISQKYDTMISTSLSKLNTEIDKLTLDIQQFKSEQEIEVGKAKQQLIELSSSLTATANKEVEVLKKSISDLEIQKESKKNEVLSKTSDLKSKLFDAELNQSKLVQYERRVLDIQVQIKSKEEFKPSEETLKSLVESIKHDEEGLETQQKHRDENARVLEILNFWKTAFSDSGIKSMLIDVAIPHMNQCVREELDRVCPGTFTVSFDTLSTTKAGNIRDKFSINITHNLKCATGHKKLSGGEKRIIDFCCMAALRSLAEKLYGKMFCHILYDEVLDSLDSDSRELFCRSMKNQSTDQRHVLLVTHALTEDVDPDRVFPF